MLAPWMIPAGRAVLALALGLAITFTGGHTAEFGLIAFGVFAVASGLLLLAAAVGPRAEPLTRTALLAQGAVSAIAGIAALVLPSGGIGYLVWVLSGWAIVCGALELVSGIRSRGRATAWRDGVVVGALTVLLGVVALVLPPDIADFFSGDKGVEGLLTSSIIIVGMLGAWAVITGVLLAISSVSPRIVAARTAEPRTAEPRTTETRSEATR